LQPLVRFYWLVEDSGIADLTTETVIPDGCMEMIFSFRRTIPFRAGARAVAHGG
jgi:hypothetical protein